MTGNANDDAFVEFDRVQKSYDGETLVVKDLNLALGKGEFLTMLGPSGSGNRPRFTRNLTTSQPTPEFTQSDRHTPHAQDCAAGEDPSSFIHTQRESKTGQSQTPSPSSDHTMKHNERARVAPLYLTFTHPLRTKKNV